MPPADLDDLLGGPEVVVPPELVADLHRPGLVITPDFVGPDRRRAVGHRDRATGHRVPGAPRPRHRRLDALIVATVTAAAVIPLTLVVVPALGGSSSAEPAGAAVASTSPLNHAGGAHRGHGRHRLLRAATRPRAGAPTAGGSAVGRASMAARAPAQVMAQVQTQAQARALGHAARLAALTRQRALVEARGQAADARRLQRALHRTLRHHLHRLATARVPAPAPARPGTVGG